MNNVVKYQPTIADIQKHFITPMTQQEITHYQARLTVAQGVDWKHGAYYAIGDANDLHGSYPLFGCCIEDGVVYLGAENACGEIDGFEPVYFVVYHGCRIIPQL